MMNLRQKILNALPNPVRAWLRGARDFSQRAEARVRARLPVRLGGRFGPSDVECRLLDPGDVDAYIKLMSIQPGPETREKTREILGGDTGFAMGIFISSKLVAAGWCHEQWAGMGIKGFWMAGDLVDPKFRRRGLAQLLHGARLEEAGRRNVEVVRAVVFSRNKASRQAYKALGWTRFNNPEWERKIRDHYKRHGVDKPEFALLERLVTSMD